MKFDYHFWFAIGWVMYVVAMGIIIIVSTHMIASGSGFDNHTTVDCIRMFYSDEWNKGYVTDLAEFCREGNVTK